MRWRDVPKPTIAQVQGHAIIGGMMFAMSCDLIVAADNAIFQDHAARWSAMSGEFFSHPWDLGIRKAKKVSAMITAKRENFFIPRDRLPKYPYIRVFLSAKTPTPQDTKKARRATEERA